ncbi:TIM23 complex component [Sporothrix bragantina]|uniref:Presequence translocated-associated motor subunit PAM17 n=1 Tax=Sporothrix bragantina TaxID=671064 RepID=A0ABP0AU10_9PEZI
MLTSSAPTLLRPGLTVASRTGSSLHKPATATAKTSAALLLRRQSPMSVAAVPSMSSMTPMQTRSLVTALPLKRKITPSSPTLRRCASSSSTSSHRTPPQTGASVNRDAAADAAAAAAIAARTKTQASAGASSASSATSTDGLPPLDWNTFFALRKTRRRIQLGFSVAGGLTGGLVGGLFLGSGVAEPLLTQIPLDPFLTLGLMTFGFATLGWLAGPSVGNVVFYAWKRQYKTQMTLKETQFFARIKRNRVDPSASSAGNPVPDFYGEKISSVAGYRQWLKDQRAFNKKRTTFV